MSIKIPLRLNSVDKAGKDCQADMMMHLSDPVEAKNGPPRQKRYRCQFSLRIPDHIYNYLAGRLVPSLGIHGGDKEPIRFGESPDKGFPRTLSSPRMEDVIAEWENLLKRYRWLRDVDHWGFQKTIFYEFITGAGDYADEWSRKKRLGSISRIDFCYAIGYRVAKEVYTRSSDHRYDSNMNLISISEQRFYRMKFVKWTEEREKFFASIQVNFESVISRINEFEKGLSERKINKLIAAQRPMLGAGE